MIRAIFSCFNGKVSNKKVRVEPLDEVTEPVYRYDLTKKQTEKKRVKKTVRFAESEPAILGEENEKGFEKTKCDSGNEVAEKEVTRVRVKLTKEEAAKLLSKCNGGVLEFKDVANQLVLIPVNRVCIMSKSDPTQNL